MSIPVALYGPAREAARGREAAACLSGWCGVWRGSCLTRLRQRGNCLTPLLERMRGSRAPQTLCCTVQLAAMHACILARACLRLPAPRRSVLTDEALRVKGSDGSIWALGDASTIDQPKVGAPHASASASASEGRGQGAGGGDSAPRLCLLGTGSAVTDRQRAPGFGVCSMCCTAIFACVRVRARMGS